MKSPLKDAPLRNPGDTLQKQILALIDDKIVTYYFFATFMVIFAGLEWLRYYNNSEPNPLLFSFVAIVSVAIALWKIVPAFKQIRKLKQGLAGEKSVGQFLERLRESGAKVFHDIPCGEFNLDHVVIHSSGIYVIETKTYSKPDKRRPTITFNGKSLNFSTGIKTDKPLVQVAAGAMWLRDLIAESTGEKMRVKGVVVFPGWYIEHTPEAKRSDHWVLNPKALPAFITNQKPALPTDKVHMVALHLSRYVRSCDKKTPSFAPA